MMDYAELNWFANPASAVLVEQDLCNQTQLSAARPSLSYETLGVVV
jgi:hypothetical protein